MPVFLPGIGAYVRWAALGVTAETRAFVSLAGPMAGCIGAAVCALLWMKTGEAFWIGLSGAPSHAATAYYLIVLTARGYFIQLAPMPPTGG